MLESQILELSHEAIIIASASRVIERWNTGAEELYGIPRERAIGRTLPDLLGTRGTDAIDAVLSRDGRWEGELVHTRPDGSLVSVESRQTLIRGASGAPATIVVINRDITARKRAEAALRASEERYRAFMDNSPTIAWIKDESGRVVYVSKAFERALETRFEDWRGKTDFDVWPRQIAEKFRRSDLEALESGKPFESLEETVAPDGSRRYWWAVKFPFSDAAGNRYLGGVALDITGQKRMEERIWQTQKLESLGVLAAGIAHTFNNLLTVVLGNATLAKEKFSDCAEFEAITAAAERAAGLTRQLMDYVGKAVSSPRRLRLSSAAAEIVELLRASIPAKIELRLDLKPDYFCVVADPAQVQQILLNLVTNAAEAIGPAEAGVVHVTNGLRELAAGQSLPGYTLAPGRYVTVSVTDTGSGMNEETMSRIFDPFFTTKFAGRGLGLAAVAGIVRTLGGAIAVESAEGRGSMFTVLLPALTAEEPREPLQAAGPLPRVTMTE